MAGGIHVMDMIKSLNAQELLKEKRHLKVREKCLNVSAEIHVDFEKATREERAKIKHQVEKARKKDLAHSMYIIIVSVLLTVIFYFLVGMIFK